jgi:serine acetyltransferase
VLGQKGETATKGPITIEDDVWIGSYSIILSGIRIGKGAVVAAGSVVVNDVEPYSIVGGNPAKFIRYRIDQKLINDAKDIDLNRITYGYTKQNVGLLYEPLDASVLKRIVESFRS